MGDEGEKEAGKTGEVYPLLTFLGENTPTVPPSSRMATPISAKSASLWNETGKNENVYMFSVCLCCHGNMSSVCQCYCGNMSSVSG